MSKAGRRISWTWKEMNYPVWKKMIGDWQEKQNILPIVHVFEKIILERNVRVTFSKAPVSFGHVRTRHHPSRRRPRPPLSGVRVHLNRQARQTQAQRCQKALGRTFEIRVTDGERTHRRIRQSSRPLPLRPLTQGDALRKTQAGAGRALGKARRNLETPQDPQPPRPRTRTGSGHRDPRRPLRKNSHQPLDSLGKY